MSKVGQSKANGGTLRRLVRDQSGNTLAMMAALLIPLIGMVGSGVDMARAYMAKAKLQTACDAGATAARRLMGASAFNDTARQEGRKFFLFNFPSGTMNTSPVALTVEAASGDASVVEINASTNVPTEIMGIFGATSIPISVTCQADRDYVNNDIMLVLDVTGSMNCAIGSGMSGCSDAQGALSNSRVSALRAGAPKLFEALADAGGGVVTRYGFMPYSVATNVGRDLNLNWVRQSGITYHVWGGSSYTSNNNYSKTNTWLTGTWRAAVSDTAAPSLTLPGYWGCVEERSSYANRANANITISSTVSQEDIDYLPGATENTLKWVPYDPQTAVVRSGGGEACPAPASRLATVASASAFQSRLNAAIRYRGGNTHHDVGMVWGMRYLSSTGMFAAQNPAINPTNGLRVDRHIVFFTDGLTQVGNTWYSNVGIPQARQRTTGSGTDAARAKARFLGACTRARQMGITVWVIALDDAFADPELGNCASSSGHFFVAEDAAALDNAFDTIGRGIGKLRLTQ